MTEIESLIIENNISEAPSSVNFYFDQSRGEHYVIDKTGKITIYKLNNPLNSPKFEKKEFEINVPLSFSSHSFIMTSPQSKITIVIIENNIYLEKIRSCIFENSSKIEFQKLGLKEAAFKPIKIKFHPVEQSSICVLYEKGLFRVFDSNINIEEAIFSYNFRFDIKEKIVDFSFVETGKFVIDSFANFNLFLLSDFNDVFIFSPILVGKLKMSDAFISHLDLKIEEYQKEEFGLARDMDVFKGECVDYNKRVDQVAENAGYIFNDKTVKKIKLIGVLKETETSQKVLLFHILLLENVGSLIILGVEFGMIVRFSFHLIVSEINPVKMERCGILLLKEFEINFEKNAKKKVIFQNWKICVLLPSKICVIDLDFLRKLKREKGNEEKYLEKLNQNFEGCFYVKNRTNEFDFVDVYPTLSEGIRILGFNKFHKTLHFAALIQKNKKTKFERSVKINPKKMENFPDFKELNLPQIDFVPKINKNEFNFLIENLENEFKDFNAKILASYKNNRNKEIEELDEEIIKKIEKFNSERENLVDQVIDNLNEQKIEGLEIQRSANEHKNLLLNFNSQKKSLNERLENLKKRFENSTKKFGKLYTKFYEKIGLSNFENNELNFGILRLDQDQISEYFESEMKEV